MGKPEAYYFPPQYNETDNDFPLHVHGAHARDDEGAGAAVSRELERGDNGITFLSQAFRLEPAPAGKSIRAFFTRQDRS